MSEAPQRTVHVEYFAVMRERAGLSRETVTTTAATCAELYDHLSRRHGFTLEPPRMKVVVNEEFRDWTWPLEDGDTVVFVPPVAGG